MPRLRLVVIIANIDYYWASSESEGVVNTILSEEYEVD